jgi:O-antigen ligase
LLSTFVQFALFAIVLSGMRRAPVMHVVIAATCCLAAVTDLGFWVINPGVAMADDGFAGLQGQKNQAGLLMMYGILAAVPCIFLVRQWIWRIALAGGTVIMLALLAATRSSTSVSVVAMDAAVIPAILLIAKLPRRVIWLIVFVSLFAVATAAFGYLAWAELVGRDPLLPLRGATFTNRTDIWFFVVDEIKKRPWFGSGYASFWSIDPTVQPSLKSDQWFAVDVVINEAHDGYLDALATGGIFGLVGCLIVLFRSIAIAGRAVAGTRSAASCWRDGGMARPTAAFHLALTLGLVLHNFTESNLFSNNALLAVALLLAMLDLEKWRITERAASQPG